jgi:hypothetical protein
MYVTSDSMVGDLPKFSKYINLSSAPNDTVAITIGKMSQISMNARSVSLNGRCRYIHDTKNIITLGKPEKVVVVLDEDDFNKDIKVRNICARNNYSCVGKIIFRKEKSKNDDNTGNTLIERFANHHHKRSVLKSLNAGTFNNGIVKNISYGTVVKTNDDHAGSIAGLTVALNMRGISFHVTHAQVAYPEGWITTRKRINRMDVKRKQHVADINPEDDKMWAYKTGYDNYFNTDLGPSEVKMLEQNEKKRNDSLMLMIIRKVQKVIVRVGEWLLTKLGRKQRKTNETKHKLAWTEIVKHCANVTNTTCLTYAVRQENNPGKQIKEANKLISTMQVNKMLSKVGPTGDKTSLTKRKDSVFDAYMTAATSYNIGDATTHANNQAAKQNRSNRLSAMYVSTAITTMYFAITGYYIIALIILILTVILSITQQIEPEALILLNMIITSGTVGGILVNTTIAMIEMVLKPPSSTRGIRTAIYMGVWFLAKI